MSTIPNSAIPKAGAAASAPDEAAGPNFARRAAGRAAGLVRDNPKKAIAAAGAAVAAGVATAAMLGAKRRKAGNGAAAPKAAAAAKAPARKRAPAKRAAKKS